MTEQPQTKKTGGRRKIIFIVFLLLILITNSTVYAETIDAPIAQDIGPQPYRVLFLNFKKSIPPWTFSMFEACRSELEHLTGHPVIALLDNVSIENTDTEEVIEALSTLIRERYNGQIDFIVARGNFPALEEIQSALPNIPIILPTLDSSLEGKIDTTYPDLYINFVKISPSKSVLLGLDLFPKVSNIIVISGEDSFGQLLNERAFEEMGHHFEGASIEYWSGETLLEMKTRIASLPDDNLVLFLGFKTDQDGGLYVSQDVVKELSGISSVPILGIADNYFGDGIVAGYVESSVLVGHRAARMLAKLISGSELESVSLVEDYGEYMLDWVQMKRWGIPESRIPAQSTILNLPDNYLERYPWIIPTISVITVILITTIFILLINLKQETRSKRKIEYLSKFPDENPTPVLRLSKEGKILYANKSSAPLLTKWSTSVGKNAPSDWKKSVANSFASDENLDFERVVEDRTYSFILTPIKDMGYVNAYGRDITERKSAEDAIKKHVSFLNTVMDNSPIAMWIADVQGTIIRVNSSLLNILNLSEQALVGKYNVLKDINLVKQKVMPSVEAVFKDKVPTRFVIPCPGDDTGLSDYQGINFIWIDVSMYPVVDANNNLINVVCQWVDITDLKQTEEEIRSLSLFPNESPHPILRLSKKGKILYASKSSAALLKKWGKSIGENVPPKWEKNISNSFTSEVNLDVETICDGKAFSFILAPIKEMGYVNAYGRDITNRKAAEKEVQQHIKRLGALHYIDQAIMGSFDLDITLNIILEQIQVHLEVDAAAVLSYQADLQMLQFTYSRGFQTAALQYTDLRLGEGYAGEVGLQRKPVFIPDLNQDEGELQEAPQFNEEGFVSYYGVPLIAKGKLVGVLEIFHRSPLDPEIEWVNYLKQLSNQAAIAIDNITLFINLQRSNLNLTMAYDATIEGWAHALELKDIETEGHSRRVVEITMDMARRMGIKEEKLRQVRRGALLHDIGKMGIPDAILQKPGKLTDEEWQVMRQHPVYAFEWLSAIKYLRPALEIPYSHHERWDGTGYPRGLEGEQIPLEARIFAIVDVWDALRSDRPYRKAWSKEKTLTHIKEQSGRHFDPQVVDVFLEQLSL